MDAGKAGTHFVFKMFVIFLGRIKKGIWRLRCVKVYSSFSVVKSIVMIF